MPDKVVYWTKAELSYRERLPSIWSSICNSNCKRRVFLQYLGECLAPTSSLGIPDQVLEQCCNGCNPELIPVLTQPPAILKKVVGPRANTRASITLDLLDK